MWRFSLLLVFLSSCGSAYGYCFEEAGRKYGIDPVLIEAIAYKESRFNKNALNKNRSSSGVLLSTDYGVMQINTVNAEALVGMGKMRKVDDLLVDACFNVKAGAWVLAKHLRVCGRTWSCLGSYNAGFKRTAVQEQKRLKYANDVRRIYIELKSRRSLKAKYANR